MSTLDNAPETAVEPRPVPPRPAPATPLPGRMEPLNLARRPFLNSRPVVRASLLFWTLGLLLLLGNVFLFQAYLTDSADKRQQIARGEEEIERQQRAAQQLAARLDSIDLERLNEQVDFLNEKIEQRTFSWSLLLGRLAEVLPNDVRLNRLAPDTGEKAKQRAAGLRGGRKPPEGSVFLTMTGESRSDEALLQFVDHLFAHPAFRDPNLMREERQEETNLVRFELSVIYIPRGRPQPAGEEAPTVEEVPLPGSAAGTAPPSPVRGTAAPPAADAPGGRP